MPPESTQKMITSFDIETTGLCSTDQVTTVGFLGYDGYDIYVDNSTNIDFDNDSIGDDHVTIHTSSSEGELLSSISSQVMDEDLDVEGELIFGFNSVGFDLKMLRTRCYKNEVDWPFSGVAHVDLESIMKYDFNTKSSSIKGLNKDPLRQFGQFIEAPVTSNMLKNEIREAIEKKGYKQSDVDEFIEKTDNGNPTHSHSSLEGVYEDLIGDSPFDPLESSEQAISRWQSGDVTDVVSHNMADLKMTRDLALISYDYAPEEDIRVDML